MSKRIFTQQQIVELRQNSNVLRCSEKSITYHKSFKIEAVRKYLNEGVPVMQIFKQAGFNLDIIGRKTPKHCLQSWRRVFAQKGAEGFLKERRGGPGRRKSIGPMSDQEKLKYYEAQAAYLKAENAFLAKLRKQRLN